ncbi:NHL repeat-containing protein [Nocardioides hungaricus]
MIATGSVHTGVLPGHGFGGLDEAAPASYGGWRPRAILGADSPGGLQLPAAAPAAGQLYAPRAAWTDGQIVVAADTGNHRVMIWHGVPTSDGVPADVVLGQPDEHTEGPAAGGLGPAVGMQLPTGVLVHEGRLVVADAWHHRILMWDTVPTVTGTPPDRVLGQVDAHHVEANRGGEADAASFYWPFGIAVIGGRFYVADTGNRRVLVWRDGVPTTDRPADVVLGQPGPADREENRGDEAGADSFRWPHDIAAAGDGIVVADAGNHRLLRWARHPETDCPADAVLGQLDMTASMEFPYVSQAGRFRFPYAVSTTPSGAMAVADTANNRVLIYGSVEATHDAAPDAVLGQPTFAANGENRWEQVAADTLCWPYGVHWHPGGGDAPDLLLVADSGNNRIAIWERP